MAKTVPSSKFQEWKGLDRISLIVHEMKCIFRETSKDDFGIDGEIEIVIPKANGDGFETYGKIVKVQAKSGIKYVTKDSKNSFSAPVERNDLDLWYRSTYPVIFIVYHPKEEKLYWKEVKSYVKSTPKAFQPPYQIPFNKATDEFSTECYPQICQLAEGSPPRISTLEREQLYSNLLPIKRLPKLITYAPTKCKDYEQIRSQITGFVPPFCLIEERLYTLSDLQNEKCVLRNFCDHSNTASLSAEEWVKNEIQRNNYVFLLNQLLGIHLRRCGLSYNRDYKRNYFPRKDETSLEFKQIWFNVRTKKQAPPRIVAKYYEYGANKFWRHLAVNLSFKFIGSAWFLQVVPKYLFTKDGKIPWDSEKIGSYTTKIKAQERNIHVLNHVLFWAAVLSKNKQEIEIELDFKTVMVIEKKPLSGIANFSISFDPAIYEESEETGQLSLLELLPNTDDEDKEDEYYF